MVYLDGVGNEGNDEVNDSFTFEKHRNSVAVLA